MREPMDEKKVISLPDELDADQIEHLGAAILAVGGLYVKKNITEKVVTREEVEEIDAFGSAWKDGRPHRVIIEAKSGDWGARDLFTLLGRKVYLEADVAVLLHSKEFTPPKYGELIKRFENKGHRVVILPAGEALSSDQLIVDTIACICREEKQLVYKRLKKIYSLCAWRYAFWTERALLRHLLHEAKSYRAKIPSLRASIELLDRINDCFFMPDYRDQAFHLYEFHFKHQNLVTQMIEEMRLRAPGDELRELSPDDAFRTCVYEGKAPAVQATMYLQHRARCLLLKTAVDAMLTPRSSGSGFKLKHAFIPESFRAFAEEVRNYPNLEKLPLLWQVYILGWGGFIVTSRAQEEHESIGLEVGLAPEEVEQGLKVFDHLFPLSGGWHFAQEGTGIKLLKFVPNVFRGLGVQRRRWIYGYENLFGGLPHLGLQDCKLWAECEYELLRADVSPS